MQELVCERFIIEKRGWTDKPQERFIQIDRSGSGGYPNIVAAAEAELFHTQKAADDYKDIFARTATTETDSFGALNWEVKRALIYIEDIPRTTDEKNN